MSVAVPDFLYHGSIVEFSRPDVTKGRGFKDFGRGFYMSVADRLIRKFEVVDWRECL